MSDKPLHIAVIGLGGIGGVAAACLALAGRHRITVCARRPIERLRLDFGEASRAVSIRTITDPSDAEPADWVFLATKAHETGSAANWLSALCRPGTGVAVLQNGIGHERRVAPFAPDAEILPAIVYYNGERIAPDHMRLRRVQEHDLIVPAGPLAERFTALFDDAEIRAGQREDFITLQWRKLLINVIANPITALTRQRLHIFQRPDIQELSLGILREAVKAGRANGADLDDDEAEKALATLLTYPADASTSMYFDCLAGRPLEIEALTGEVVAAAHRHGIDAPLNGSMLALLRVVSETNAAAAG